MSTTLGILGAGRVGMAIARQGLRAGYEVAIAASGDPGAIELIVQVMVPGARAVTASEAARSAELVVLSVPLNRYATLDAEIFAGRVVVDAMNHWADTDGPLPALAAAPSSSEMVAVHLNGAHVVKTLNHIGYHELEADPTEAGTPGRRALAVAGDDDAARAKAMELIEALGFDAVDAGALAAGVHLEPGTRIFSGWLDRSGRREQLGPKQPGLDRGDPLVR